MIITQHARSRYRERVRPEASDLEVDADLAAAVASATPTGERTFKGQALWVVPSTGLRLVTKHDAKARVPVVVTVLEPGAPVDGELMEDATRIGQQELAREAQEAEERLARPVSGEPGARLTEPRRGLAVVAEAAPDEKAARALHRVAEAKVIWNRKKFVLAQRVIAQDKHIAKFAADDARRVKRSGGEPRTEELGKQRRLATEATRKQVESDERWLVDYLKPVLTITRIRELARGTSAWPTTIEDVKKLMGDQ